MRKLLAIGLLALTLGLAAPAQAVPPIRSTFHGTLVSRGTVTCVVLNGQTVCFRLLPPR
jgi:hypothetical protein